MYRLLVFIYMLPLITGCFLRVIPAPKVPNEYINVFTESIVRMRDGRDPRVLNLNEGQRIGERAFRGVNLSVILSYFKARHGTCNLSESRETKYVCTVKKLVLTNRGQLGTTAGSPCDKLVQLTYEFYYPGAASHSSTWESMRFYATTGDRDNCRAKIMGTGYEHLYL